MRTLNLKLDFGIDRSDEKNKDAVEDVQITRNVIAYVFSLFYKDGIKSDKRRIVSKVLAKLQDALAKKADTVDLNEMEYISVREAFENVVIPPDSIRNVDIVEEMVLASKSVNDPKPEAKKE